jgi:DNA-binding SARP family transcriptional activator
MQQGYTPASALQTREGDLLSNRTVQMIRANRQEPFDLLQADDLDISLLGAFQVRVDGRIIVETDWPLRRARNLMKLLALAPDHQMHREQIIDFLWPEQTQDAAANNLHKALHVARHVLEPNLPGKVISRYIQLQEELIVLRAPGQVRVDVETFRALAEASYASDAPEAYLKALSIYVSDLLPQDQYEDWAILHRERLKDLRLQLLLRLARVYEERNETDSAIRALQQIVDVDSAHEEAHGRLMILLTRSGARQTALRQYHRLEAALKYELDAVPAPSIQKLYHDVLENRLPEQKQDSAFARLNEGGPSSTVAPPRVVGRDQEVRELVAYLRATAEGVGNLVIIDGEAGSGKTHLMKTMASYAMEQGFATLMGEAPMSAVQPPHTHLSSAFTDFIHRSRVPDRFTVEAATLSQMLTPMTETHLSAPGGGNLDMPHQAIVLRLIGAFFKNLCIQAPVLLMLDDVHAADEASLQIVKVLAELVHRIPLLMVISLRRFDRGRPSPQFDCLVSSGQHAGVALTLQPLAFSETAELVSQLLDAPVERSVLETVNSIAGGLPHFIYETVFALMGRDGIQLVEGRWTLNTGDAFGLARDNLRQPRLEGTSSADNPRNLVLPGVYSRA